MSNRKEAPEVNAGSMADIAFLLLIFFLVTTVIETDAGLDRMLPRVDDTPIIDVNDRNLLQISLNEKDELLVEEVLVDIEDLKGLAITFLDNGGAPLEDSAYCDYCKGERNPNSSDSPVEAIISLTSHRQANYGAYIAVQNELVAAYGKLRDREANKRFGTTFRELEAQYLNPTTSETRKQVLKSKILEIQKLFPMQLIEAEIQ